MTRPRFDPNPMPLWLWILSSTYLAFGVILIVGAVFDRPISRFMIGGAGICIAIEAYDQLWGKRRQCEAPCAD